jgi:hypothetical protein
MKHLKSCGNSVFPGCELPSGKHTKNYGNSPFLMGKPSISMGHVHPFSMAMLNKQRVDESCASFPGVLLIF